MKKFICKFCKRLISWNQAIYDKESKEYVCANIEECNKFIKIIKK